VALKLLSLVSTIAVVLLTVGLSQVPDSYAIGGTEYEPTQPNAVASYNNATNQVQVNWDFTNSTLGSAPTTCLLKGDVTYNEDLESDQGTNGEIKSSSFIPLFYSAVTQAPVILEAGNLSAEEVPCTGNMRIDIDTVMSHSTNVNNSEGLQIFLTFYVPNSDGSLNLSKIYRIDEVFVMYAPNSVFTQPTYQTYGCDGQIGSTLYIDGSGSNGSVIAYGDNGDNCGDHLYLENDQWVDISMEPNNGNTTYGSHQNDSFQLLWRVTTGEGGGGDDCSADCRPPTLESLVFNNSPNWLVANNQTFNIGDKQVFKFSYSDNRGIDKIDQVEIGFGLPSMYSTIFDPEIIIEINTNNEVFESLKITDENNLWTNSTTVTVDKIDCVSDDCLELEYTLEFTWAEIPFDGYFLMTSTDSGGNTSYDRLTEELFVIGETLNEQPTLEIYNRSTSSMNDGLSITITRTDKVRDMWIDEKSRYWQGFGNDRFDIIPLTLAALLNNH